MKSLQKIALFPFAVLLPLSLFSLMLVYRGQPNYRSSRWLQLTSPRQTRLKESSSCAINVSIPKKRAAAATTTTKRLKQPIQFSTNFRNPCWYEELDGSDVEAVRHSPYLSVKKRRSIRSGLLQLAQLYEEQLRANRTYRLRCLPAFHIIGQVKCGTTDLYQRLAKHPQVHMGVMKEPDWWTRARFGIYKKLSIKTVVPMTSYVDLFGLAAIKLEEERVGRCLAPKRATTGLASTCHHHQSLIGDASVATFSDDTFFKPTSTRPSNLEPNSNYTTANYIKWLLPDAKIIVLVREPVARLFSDYLFFHESETVSQQDFHKRVVYSLRVFRRCRLRFDSLYCVRERSIRSQFKTNIHFGLYSVYLEEWLRVFPQKQLSIVRMEDYASDTIGTLRKIFRFLEICDLPSDLEKVILSNEISNFGVRKIGPMWNETRILLKRFYRRFNRDLAHLLNDDGYLWDDGSDD